SSAGVVIAGPAGVGKTRLARECVAALGPDVAVEWAGATAATASIPFGAMIGFLTDVDLDSDVDRLRVLRRAVAGLRGRAGSRSLVLVVDDAHRLDSASAAFVHHLVVSEVGRVVLTTRTDEATSEEVVALWKDGLIERIDLAPLAAPEVDELLEHALGGAVDAPSRGRFFELS